MQLWDAWALAVFAERARQNPENPLKVLLCKLLTLELGQQVKPDKRELLLALLPKALQDELAASPQLFPKPKAPSHKAVLVHTPTPAKGFWRSLLGA
jgi:hypothetical protein